MHHSNQSITNFRNRHTILVGTLTFRLEESSTRYIDVYLNDAPYPHNTRPLVSTLLSRWKSHTTKYIADLWELLHLPSSSSPSPEEAALRDFLTTHLKEIARE